MRRILVIFLLLANVTLQAHSIDSLYGVFLANRGDRAVRVANEIAVLTGDTVVFTTESSLDSMNAVLLKQLIYWHFDRSEYVEVVSYSNKAIELYRQQDDLFNLAGCYNVLGVSYQYMGRYEDAINSYNQCNEVMAKLNAKEATPFYERNIRYTTNNIANIFCSMGELDKACDLFSNCIEMLGEPQTEKDYLDLATYFHNLSDIYLLQAETMEGEERQEKIKKALSLLEQALNYSFEYNDMPQKIIHRLIVLSKAYLYNGQAQKAFETLDDAKQRAEAIDNLFLQSDVENHYGELRYLLRQYRDAEAHYKEAIAAAEKGRFIEQLVVAYKGASDASRHFDAEQALKYMEQSEAYKDTVYNKNQQALIREYQVKYDLSQMEHQLELQKKSNKLKTIELTAFAIFSGLLVALLVILVRLIRVRRKQNQTLERLNQTQQRILSVASHDVKTMVLSQNIVLKLANEHFDNMDREELKETIVMLKSGSDEMKDKLYSILHWISGEMGREAIASEEFNLSAFIDKRIELHSEELKYKKLNVENNIPKNCMCFDKKNTVDIVFQNLITNAIKFTSDGGYIKVSAIDDGNQVWVVVSDNGMGIAPELLQQLTHETVISSKGTHGERGSGVGLFVSRQLMVKNGGQLIIESEVGQGTSIRFNVKKAKS